jgi:hypothetical protein
MAAQIEQAASWPQRIIILAVGGAIIGFCIQQLGEPALAGWPERIAAALAMLLGVGGTAFALAWQRGSTRLDALVALASGAIAGSVMLWQGGTDGPGDGDGWPIACGLFVAGMLLVFHQTAEREGRPVSLAALPGVARTWWRDGTDYPALHGHLWTNALILGAAALFTGLSIGIAHLLAEMFALIKFTALQELLRKEWAMALLVGGSVGGGIGLLRERSAIIGALQRVAMLVLRVLAPVLAVGLAIFLLLLPFTGLAPLWETGGTTPLMLGGAMLALFLCNAVIDDRDEDAPSNRLLRWAGMILALVLVPMVLIAAYSSGLRISQHGLSPDRLWALAFIVVASIVAVGYIASLLARTGWMARLRHTNLRLSLILAGVALLLALPILSFERIATANQIARLENGKVKPLDFDYAALWWDYGPPGREAIKKLAASGNAEIRQLAGETMKMEARWDTDPVKEAQQAGAALDKRLTILPKPVLLPQTLRHKVGSASVCSEGWRCTLVYQPNAGYAVVSAQDVDCKECFPQISILRAVDDGWAADYRFSDEEAKARAADAAIRAGKVELRNVTLQQVYVDGKPLGEPFEAASPQSP